MRFCERDQEDAAEGDRRLWEKRVKKRAKKYDLPLAQFVLSSSDYRIRQRRLSGGKSHPSPDMSERIDKDELEALLKKLPEWDHEGNEIVRVMEFDEFMEGIDFVDAVAEIAEEAGHHPDIDIRWCTVTLRLTTHDAGGLTELDIEVAKKIDTLVD